MHTNRRPNACSLALLTTLGMCLGMYPVGGCAHHQVADTQSALPADKQSQVNTNDSVTLEDSMDILSELFQSLDTPITMGILPNKSDQLVEQPVGPQLVAGDWLAWQCAIAGNYWEMENGDNARFALTPDDAAD